MQHHEMDRTLVHALAKQSGGTMTVGRQPRAQQAGRSEQHLIWPPSDRRNSTLSARTSVLCKDSLQSTHLLSRATSTTAGFASRGRERGLDACVWQVTLTAQVPVIGAFQSCIAVMIQYMCIYAACCQAQAWRLQAPSAHSSGSGGAGAVCPAVASADATCLAGALTVKSGLRGEVSDSARRAGCAAGAGLPYGAVAGANADARGLATASLTAPATAGAVAGALAADASALVLLALAGARAAGAMADRRRL